MFLTAVLWYKVSDLSVKAISAVARARSGMSLEQWKQFYALTHYEGVKIHKTHPDWSWGSVPPSARIAMKNRVNAKLAKLTKADGENFTSAVPKVDDVLLSWRMTRVTGDIQKKERRRSAGAIARHKYVSGYIAAAHDQSQKPSKGL